MCLRAFKFFVIAQVLAYFLECVNLILFKYFCFKSWYITIKLLLHRLSIKTHTLLFFLQWSSSNLTCDSTYRCIINWLLYSQTVCALSEASGIDPGNKAILWTNILCPDTACPDTACPDTVCPMIFNCLCSVLRFSMCDLQEETVGLREKSVCSESGNRKLKHPPHILGILGIWC